MQQSAHVVLILDLLQDFNILRPIACLAAFETDMPVSILVSKRFTDRDSQGLWATELSELVKTTGASVLHFQSDFEVYSYLASKRGILFAGSESDLNAHATSHRIFRFVPSDFLKVTLQHGYECVGFLQNREQSMAFGEDIRFAADIVCSWMDGEHLHHLRPTERAKLMVTGPSARLKAGHQSPRSPTPAAATGLICENLHSVRMNIAGDFKASYMDTFFGFSGAMDRAGRSVALRPHPGGQYVIRNGVKLPPNVVLENEPMYRVDLSRYAYGISAPSSVLIDMVLAGIPTAVWHDGGDQLDTGNYAGLARVSSLEEWCTFAEAAIANPTPFLLRQTAFLEQTGILVDHDEVRKRFLNLLWMVSGRPAPRRILFVANSEIPTLQLGFFKPLQPLIDAGVIETRLLTEAQMRRILGKKEPNPRPAQDWISAQIQEFQPDVAVFCRYSGPFAEKMIGELREHKVPIMFHIDDDLLNVPIEIGEAKHFEHNKPERLDAVGTLLREANLVYCSTPPLLQRFGRLGFDTANMAAGAIYCSAEILAPAVERPVHKVGYMGFDHAHDFELVLPELVRFLRERPDIQFELFGSIPKPSELDEFAERVTIVPPVRPYSAFLAAFAERQWDIGICPLATTDFNVVKANTKWVEYASVGAAVVATAGMAYDECCADDCGILIDGAEGWCDAMHMLCNDPKLRYQLVLNAQAKIARDYSVERLRDQVLGKIDEAQVRAATNSENAL
ncbi:Glycosyl transferases group 1 [Novosphingobium mathurense]|uniref:Glycosyl transferases group 1 n=1 Tax=Novosphingobium mathurense TaxID=428990 RepID=A0A1U6ITJ0_9SPHN|nr:Glycosyl transferases group 1 [Novosphingobium mathurense]